VLSRKLKIDIYRTKIFPVLLYGFETWSLTLMEGNWLRAFENRVLWNTLGFKGDEVTGDWSRVHHDILYHLYSSPNIIGMMKSRRIRWTGRVARMGYRGGAYRISAGGPDSRRPLQRPGPRW
jgi:hypothetical protein